MILVYIIVILLAGAFLAWISGNLSQVWPRIISLITLSIDLLLIITYLTQPTPFSSKWMIDIQYDWITQFGIGIHFG